MEKKAEEETQQLAAKHEEDLAAKEAQAEDKIRKLEIEVRNKNDNKEVSLGTSKINYCDPRISVAWCKNNEVGGGG